MCKKTKLGGVFLGPLLFDWKLRRQAKHKVIMSNEASINVMKLFFNNYRHLANRLGAWSKYVKRHLPKI